MLASLLVLMAAFVATSSGALIGGSNAGTAVRVELPKLVFSGAPGVGSTTDPEEAGVALKSDGSVDITVDYANDRTVVLPSETLLTTPTFGAICPHVDPTDVGGVDLTSGGDPTTAPGFLVTTAGTPIGTFLLAPGTESEEGFNIKLNVLANYTRFFIFGVPDATELVVRTFLNGATTGEAAFSFDTTLLGAATEFSFFISSSECFDEVTVSRPTEDTLAAPGTDTSGFCISGLIVGASDTDRSLLDCRPANPQFDEEFVAAAGDGSIAFGSSGSAEWASVSLVTFESGAGADEAKLQRVFFDPDSGFVGQGVDGGNAFGKQVDANGHEYFEVDDGMTDAADALLTAATGKFRFTAFWISGDSPDGKTNGGVFDFSDRCDVGCTGQRYLKHRNVAPNDVRGFTITHIPGTNGVLAQGFRVGFVDFRMPQGTLEVCADATDNPSGYSTVEQWDGCVGGTAANFTARYSGPGIGDDATACCGRLVFGCLFGVDGATEASEHQCLYDTVGLQAGNLRQKIDEEYEARGAQVLGAQANAVQAVAAKDESVRKAIAAYGDAIRAAIGLQANQTVQGLQEVFEAAGIQLGIQTELGLQGAQFVEGQQAVQAGAQAEREALGAQLDSVQKLVEFGLQGLKVNAIQAVQAVAASAEAVAKSNENAGIIDATKELLKQIPIDISSNTLLVVDSAEKDILLSLLAFKDRLRSIDGAFKVLLDQVKALVTANRIKLERELDLIKRLAHY